MLNFGAKVARLKLASADFNNGASSNRSAVASELAVCSSACAPGFPAQRGLLRASH